MFSIYITATFTLSFDSIESLNNYLEANHV